MQAERESQTLRPLFFDNQMPSDPTEPDPIKVDQSRPAHKPKSIPQIDLSLENGAHNENSSTDFSLNGWPVIGALPPKTRDNSPPPPAAVKDTEAPAAKFQDILSTFKPGLLENILSLAKQNTTNSTANSSTINQQPNLTSRPPPIIPPIGGKLPPSLSQPPPSLLQPVYNNGYDRHDEYDRDYDSRGHRDRDHGHRDRRRGHGGHAGHNRGNFRGGPHRKSPCRFYFEGNCTRGDNCTFSHAN